MKGTGAELVVFIVKSENNLYQQTYFRHKKKSAGAKQHPALCKLWLKN